MSRDRELGDEGQKVQRVAKEAAEKDARYHGLTPEGDVGTRSGGGVVPGFGTRDPGCPPRLIPAR